MKLPSQRHLFDIPDDVAYLNCGYMSPLMHPVREAGEAGLARKARPWEIAPRDFFSGSDALRAAFAALINARADDIAIVPAVSYGISTAARNLPLARGQNVIVVEDQFPSNVLPWRERAREVGAGVRTVPRPRTGGWTPAVLAALDRDTAVVALPHCHWTDGGLFDLEQIGAACRRRGIALALDVTQSLGVLPLDVQAIQPDFLACAGYKWLLGPYSVSYLYVAERWQQGVPLEHNWIHRRNAEDFARLVDYEEGFAPGARRFDMGERSNFALLPAAEAGLRQMLAWGAANVRDTAGALADEIVERVRPLGLTALSRELRAPHYLGLQLASGLPPDLLPKLAQRKVFVSVRGSAIRVTPHVYNTEADVERLVAALEGILA
ncbi:MAG: aminotransferase class V-fold PLP-dependent enzyme [Xanthomonadales bacterium]|jgi:selenocysteine lyase/cysteine desulfurase|nr:aminotransferase class V-fold PLP-dependent enzyme [Xanthomonadales bacterium]